MRALAAVRAATPLTAIKPAFVALDDGAFARPELIPLRTSSGALSSSRSSRLLLSNSRIASSLSLLGLRGLRDRLDQLALGHARASLDADTGRKLDQLRLVV